jgi:CHAD domain-containing protein
MADIAAEAGISAEDSAIQGASKLFGYLWTAAWEHGYGTAGGDADELHDMRVALRRLRTAMQNFEGPKTAPLFSPHLRSEVREERGRLGSLGDKLGAVRDYDVLTEYVTDYIKKKLGKTLDDVPGLAALERYMMTERAAAFAPMVKKLTRCQEPGNLREDFARWALGLPAAPVAGISYRTAAHMILPRRIDEVFLHVPSLQPGAAEEEQHELRKCLRRVRYTLETMSTCFPKPVKPMVQVLVSLQDLLGEMQDFAVLRETSERAFGHEPPEDVIAFNTHGDYRRRYLLGQVRRKWNEVEKSGFWSELKELV